MTEYPPIRLGIRKIAPGPCKYPNCERQHTPEMVTCLEHSIAYRALRQKEISREKRREQKLAEVEKEMVNG